MNLAHFVSPHELSDEAAAQLSELLNDLAVAFDGQYFAQITRARTSTTGVGAQPIYATTTAISAASVHTCAPALRR